MQFNLLRSSDTFLRNCAVITEENYILTMFLCEYFAFRVMLTINVKDYLAYNKIIIKMCPYAIISNRKYATSIVLL